MNLKELGKLLQVKREKLNLSIRSAAELIGISHTYLSNLEKANDPRSGAPIKPTIDTLKLISEAYKIDINELLKLSGYDIFIYNNETKDMYTGDEVAELVEGEYKAAIKDVEYFKFYKKMRKEDIDPEDLIKAYKVYLSIKENMDKDK